VTRPSVLQPLEKKMQGRLLKDLIETLENGLAIHPEDKLRVEQLRLVLLKIQN